MNYIEQIKGFWRSHEAQAYSVNEIALYFHLLEVNNISSWKTSFKRNNSKICADLGISYPTLQRTRNKLKQRNVIDFKTTNGSPNTTYTLKNIFKVMNEVVDEVVNEVVNEVASSKYKQKLKLKQKSPLPPFSEKSSFDISVESPKKEPREDLNTEKKEKEKSCAKKEKENPPVELRFPFEGETFKTAWDLWK